MRVHRAHRKSRAGCITCKLRRVKCDEKQPVCSTCERRQTNCQYEINEAKTIVAVGNLTAVSRSATQSPKIFDTGLCTPGTTSLQPLCPAIVNILRPIETTHSLELSRATLLSEYFQRACLGFIPGLREDLRHHVYLDIIPALAMRHEGVGHAIFALSALSLAIAEIDNASLPRSATSCDRPAPGAVAVAKWRYLQQAQSFYEKCMIALKRYITDLSDENADAALACSVLLVPYELAHSRFDRFQRRSSPPSSPKSEHSIIDINWMKYIRGLRSLMPTIQSQWPNRDTPINSFFQWMTRGEGLSPSTTSQKTSSYISNTNVFDHELAPRIFLQGPAALARLRKTLQGMLHLNPVHCRTSSSNEADIIICLDTLDQLDHILQIFVLCAKGQLPQSVFRVLCLWVAQMHDGFFQLLSEEHLLALAVYSHFLVYLILFDSSWWIGDMGQATLQNILLATQSSEGVLNRGDVNPCQVQDLLRWPTQIMNAAETDDEDY